MYNTNKAAAAIAVVVAVVVAAELAVVTVVDAVVVSVDAGDTSVVAVVVGAEQLVIESGIIADTILTLPIDNCWLNSVQTQIRDSQVSDKIEFEITCGPSSKPPIKRSESPYSIIECSVIALGRFGPKREE